MSGLMAAPLTIPLPAGQLSRLALLYTLAVLIVAVSLLAPVMPVWITVAGAICVAWRLRIHTGHWSFPKNWVKALLVLGCCAGIGAQFHTGLALDVYVALLITGLSLKALEIYHTRSAQRFLCIAVLALMAYLLFAQGFIATVLAGLQMTLLTAALIAINSDSQRLAVHPLAPLKSAGIVMGLAAPLMILLFVVMPRLPALWSMPLQKQEARIGMSEDMSPGDFSKTSRSAELAFRAGFFGPLPPQSELYWRGTVLDEFDGRRWKNGCDCNYQWRNTGIQPKPPNQPAYNIVLEPHNHQWIFTLSNGRLADDQIMTNGDDLFRYRSDVLERITYDVWPQSGQQPAPALTPTERQRYTGLPRQGNPRTRELAQVWRQAGLTDEAIIQKALTRYHESFFYTLEPPLLGRDSVDDFLFGDQRGFCEHFASSFVFLLRAAGVPARIVMGYQGGQRNVVEHYVSVRQYDAHAWTEVWRENQGWLRVDPTSAVAPERVERGFADLFPDSPAFSTLLGVQTRSRESLLGYLSIKLDYLDYLVGRWVLGYDTERQQALLQRLGLDSPQNLLMVFLTGFGATLAAFFLYLFRRDRYRRVEHPLTARYRQLCEVYARLGWPRQPLETPLQFAGRIAANQGPQQRLFLRLSHKYAAWSYHPMPAPTDESALRHLMRTLYWRLFWLRPGHRHEPESRIPR